LPFGFKPVASGRNGVSWEGCSVGIAEQQVTPESLLDGIVPLKVAAVAIKRSPFTLKRWADKPGGPPLIYIGRFPHLDFAKLRKWIEAQQRVVESPAPRRARRA
jgi:hypothetical protein